MAMPFRALLRGLAVLAAVLTWGMAQAAEEIRSYDVDIVVEEDGSLDVTETIRVLAEGNQIKRGIYRDFPIEYGEEDGQVSLVSFEVLGVRRNGETEPYARLREGAYVRVRIGQSDVFLPPSSEQIYEIRYRTKGHLRALQGYDELYWNVTGNEWAFPILSASVTVRLPGKARILQHAAYTGRSGESGTEFRVLAAANGLYQAQTTGRLERYEGFTIAVGWPTGTVTIPPVEYAARGLTGYVAAPMTLNGIRLGPVAAVIGTLGGAIALLLGWLRVGRDPQGGAIYPQFDPPAKLSPAAARYVRRQGFDPRCLTAAILSMAVKGALRISEQPSSSLFRDKEYTLHPLGAAQDTLSLGEKAAYRKLFPGGKSLKLVMSKTGGARVDRAKAELKSKLWDEHYGASFKRNTLYSLGGIAAGAVISVVLVFIAERGNFLSVLQWGLPALASGFAIYALAFLWFEVEDLIHGGRIVFRRLLKVLPFLIFASVAGVNIFATLSWRDFAGLMHPGFAAAGAAFGAVAVLFHFLMAAPTKAGRKIMDELAGFEMYMSAAEEDRLEMLNPPEKTPELFEALLPYAVALGLSHQWSEKFQNVLATAAAPSWYSGSSRLDIDSFDRGFSQAVSSTSTPPSRGSGGSGGGGFSGGGGGGGGGGGW
jgi:uncharacterized membrane protein YgcG